MGIENKPSNKNVNPGQWPQKSESAEYVTAHLPNQLALKMDSAGALGLYLAVADSQ